MQVLKLLQENNIDINYVLGKELGCGADGQIFELVDFPNKVIKLCVLYDCAAQNSYDFSIHIKDDVEIYI